jgi:hypothetical protein
LELARAERGVDTDAAARALGMASEEFLLVESGSTPLAKVEPEGVAKWIKASDVEPSIALSAVERSLELSVSGRSFGWRGTGGLDRQAIDDYLAALRAALGAS